MDWFVNTVWSLTFKDNHSYLVPYEANLFLPEPTMVCLEHCSYRIG